MSYRPAKFLQIDFNVTGENAYWTHNDGTGEPWIGYPYRWNVTLTVTAQPHSSHQSTPEPYFYDGRNVNVGDYIVSSGEGFFVKIVTINSQNASVVNCVVEDFDRGNIFQNSTQDGAAVGGDGDGYLFEVSEDGYPILYPIPSSLAGTLPNYFADNIIARFMKEKRSLDLSVDQVAHGFDIGDAIYLKDDGDYAKAQADDPSTSNIIGVVTLIDVPGPDTFKYRPVGPLLNVAMPSANPGDSIYLSDSTAGALTATPPASNIKKVFIYVTSTSGIYVGASGSGSGGSGGMGFQGPQGPAGGGGGDITGSGINGQIVYWDDTTNITGDSGLTYENNVLKLANNHTVAYVPYELDPLTGNVDNYTPVTKARTYLWSSDGSWTISGLNANQADGQEHFIINKGANEIIFLHESSDSIEGYRFLTPTGANISLSPNDSVFLRYIESRWHITKQLRSDSYQQFATLVEYFTLDSTAISTKQITLANYPNSSNAVAVDVIGGSSQVDTVDYIVTSNVLSWDTLGLETDVIEGDILRVIYTFTVGSSL